MKSETEASQVDIGWATRLFPSFERLARAAAAGAAGALFGASAIGCSGPTADAQYETRASNLETANWRGWGDPPGNPSHPEYPPAAPDPLTSNPVVCANSGGFSNIFVRDANNKFQGRTMALEDGVGTGNWSGPIGSLQFWSSPACSMLQPTYSTTSNLLLVGKAFDNKIYAQLLTADNTSTGPDDPANPPTQTTWGALSQTQYANGSNGFPVVASNGSRVVVTFRNGNTIIAHNRSLPFAFGSWSGAQNAPGLPFGVTLTGVPAIAYVGGSTNAFVVVIKSTTAGVIYWIEYSGTGWIGSWTRAALPHTLTSDPALEWTNYTYPDGPYTALTLYFRDETNNVVNTSVSGPSQFANGDYEYIPPFNGATILGTPSAVFGGGLEAGIRTVVVQGYRPDSTPPAQQSSNYLISEDLCGSLARCESPTP